MRFLRALFGRKDASATPAPTSRSEAKARPTKVDSRHGRVVSDLKSFPTDVVGESNYQDALLKIAGGYRRDSQAFEVPAAIALDPTNSYDPNAVKVEINGRTVGYLPAAEAKSVGEMMRQQGIETADVQAQIRGGWKTNQHDAGHFGVKLRMPRYGWIDFGVGATDPNPGSTSPRAAPKKSTTPEPASTGPLAGKWLALWGIPRDGDVAHVIAAAGGKIMASVGRSTTTVVTEGALTPGMVSSATGRKIEELRSQGCSIELITLEELRTRIANA